MENGSHEKEKKRKVFNVIPLKVSKLLVRYQICEPIVTLSLLLSVKENTSLPFFNLMKTLESIKSKEPEIIYNK